MPTIPRAVRPAAVGFLLLGVITIVLFSAGLANVTGDRSVFMVGAAGAALAASFVGVYIAVKAKRASQPLRSTIRDTGE